MNYSNCVIYTIKCKDEAVTNLYVGHPCNLKQRTERLESNYNNPNRKEFNFKLYKVIRDNGGFKNRIVEVVEKYIECNSIDDSRNREKYRFNKLRVNSNSNRPFSTVEEKTIPERISTR